jgi:hypothetical protein
VCTNDLYSSEEVRRGNRGALTLDPGVPGRSPSNPCHVIAKKLCNKGPRAAAESPPGDSRSSAWRPA